MWKYEGPMEINQENILHNWENITQLLKQKKVICFDLYGTLIYYPHSYERLKDCLKIIWIKPLQKLGYIAQTQNIDIESANKKVKGFKMPHKVIKKLVEHTADNVKSTLIYPNTLEVLEKLKEKWYKLAIISNLSKEYEEPLRNLIPKWLIDYESLSFNVWYVKPNSQIFEKIKDDSWVDFWDMLMIWDSMKLDIDWAKNVWMDSILLDRKENGIKYNEKKDLIVIHTLEDLLDI